MDNASSRAWVLHLALVLTYLVLVLYLFWPTAASIVSIWERSGTYAHGYLIVPIVVWLVWHRRHTVIPITPRATFFPLLLILPTGALWLLAEMVDVLVITQLMFVALVVLGVWVVVGNRAAMALSFPLAYLFLGVPVGEDLVNPMMEFTASFTVWAVQASGIPVYREGLFFNLPSGNWSVVEACSGVRYLIASVTLGFLFAYLTYQKLSKRILFVGLSIVVPIIANGLRAYMIVMIGHFSDMQLATGVDHLIYGWLFFGVVMLILFSIGSIWRDADLATVPTFGADQADCDQPVVLGRAVIAFIVVISCAGFWPLFAEYSAPGKSIEAGTTSLVYAPGSGWEPAHNEPWQWKPDTEQADLYLNQYFTNPDGGGTISLHLMQYFNQEQGREVVTSDTHLLTGEEAGWRVTHQGRREVGLGGRAIAAREARLSNDRQDLLVWSWYRIGSHYTANIYIGKLWQVYAQLFDRRYDAAMIMIASEFDSYTDKNAIAARERMQLFIDAGLPAVEASLDAAITAGSQ